MPCSDDTHAMFRNPRSKISFSKKDGSVSDLSGYQSFSSLRDNRPLRDGLDMLDGALEAVLHTPEDLRAYLTRKVFSEYISEHWESGGFPFVEKETSTIGLKE